jgi:hypothetical protein
VPGGPQPALACGPQGAWRPAEREKGALGGLELGRRGRGRESRERRAGYSTQHAARARARATQGQRQCGTVRSTQYPGRTAFYTGYWIWIFYITELVLVLAVLAVGCVMCNV